MNSFHFEEGSSELLNYCDNLWEFFISNQAQNAGEMSTGVEEYICNLRDQDLIESMVSFLAKLFYFECSELDFIQNQEPSFLD